MNILLIHNIYSRRGGEEAMVEMQRTLFQRSGHNVTVYTRDYSEIKTWRFGKIASFFSAFYNRRSVREVRQICVDKGIEIAVVHNLFPVVSPAVLKALRHQGVKIVMTLHNYRLVCPTGLFFNKQGVCERCSHSGLREMNCFVHNCQGSRFGSLAYALRGRWSRGRFVRSVDQFVALTPFMVDKLKVLGVESDRWSIIPNCIDSQTMPKVESNAVESHRWSIIPNCIDSQTVPKVQGETDAQKGFIHNLQSGIINAEPTIEKPFILFVGRLSMEKGVELLFSLAEKTPDIHYKVAGEWSDDISTKVRENVPHNVEILGFLPKESLSELYAKATGVVSTSVCYEGLPLGIAEAMYYGARVVVPSYDSFSTLTKNGELAIVYQANNVDSLREKIETLYSNPERYTHMSQNARKWITDNFSPEKYVNSYIELFEKLLNEQ